MLQAFGWLVAAAAYLGVMAAGEITARNYAEGARQITGGRAGGMAFAGWLIIVALFALAWALILLLRRKAAKPARYAVAVAAALLLPTVFVLFPYSGNYVADLVGGAGGSAFITGLRFGAWAGVVPFLAVPLVLSSQRLKDRFGDEAVRWVTTVLTAVFVVTMLALAVA